MNQDKTKEQLAEELHVYETFYKMMVNAYETHNPFSERYQHQQLLNDLFGTLRERGFELEHTIKHIQEKYRVNHVFEATL